MNSLVSSEIGLIHLITAIVSLIFGTVVILQKKGTIRHKQLGYIYVVAMAIMLITSFMTYKLFGKFGLFHYFSVLSSVTLLGGMIPAIIRKPSNWIEYHFAFMYWSVIGLYAAFVAEILTRVPSTPFFGMLGIAIFIVIGCGYFFWFRNKKRWSKEFEYYKQDPLGTST